LNINEEGRCIALKATKYKTDIKHVFFGAATKVALKIKYI
jgi:hypothetical protein